jgi:hypothetical protein
MKETWYREGEECYSREDYTGVAEWFRMAAEQGDTGAQTALEQRDWLLCELAWQGQKHSHQLHGLRRTARANRKSDLQEHFLHPVKRMLRVRRNEGSRVGNDAIASW